MNSLKIGGFLNREVGGGNIVGDALASEALLKTRETSLRLGFTYHKIYSSNFDHLFFFLQNNSTYSRMCNTYWLCMLHNKLCVTWKFQASKHLFVEKYEWSKSQDCDCVSGLEK
jgi:hypothetical protein